jgi:conjugative transfer signal peptidase TraF
VAEVRAIALAATAVLLPTAAASPPPLLIWNVSASVPIGLYLVVPNGRTRAGDIAAVRLPDEAGRLAAGRGYLPLDMPLLKPVAAVSGDEVCAAEDALVINGKPAARRYRNDTAGRPLPAWNGCIRLSEDQVFLLARASRSSFDSRYFGPVGRDRLIGRARLIWSA